MKSGLDTGVWYYRHTKERIFFEPVLGLYLFIPLREKFIMKLKKIVSLALAGVMTVSMLAGCNDDAGNSNNPSSDGQTTTNGFTEAVLGRASQAAQEKLTVNGDTSLDDAVAYVAENILWVEDDQFIQLKPTLKNSSIQLTMSGVFYTMRTFRLPLQKIRPMLQWVL